MKKRLFDVEEMREYLGVEIETLFSWIDAREMPYVKIGKLTKFDKKVIDAWILENSVAVEKEPKDGALRVEDIDLSEKGRKPPEKICGSCKKPKHLDLFYKDKRCKDGRVAKCKECMKKEGKERWRKRKEEKKKGPGIDEGKSENRVYKNGEMIGNGA